MALASLECSTAYSLRELFYLAHEKAEGQVTIGRSPECVLTLSGGSGNAQLMLSRSHAKLAVLEGQLQVQDCGSVNGTWVNTQQLQKQTWKVLQDGDVIILGGPPEIKDHGQLMPNPWRYKVKHLAQFLASYTPSQRPAAQQRPGAGQSGPAQHEVFRFSNALPVAQDPQAPELSRGAEQQQSAVNAPIVLQDPTQEVFRFGSSPAAGAVAEGSERHAGAAALPDHEEPPSPADSPTQQHQPLGLPAVAEVAAMQAPAQAAQPSDVIDLTMDEDSPPLRLRLLQMPRQGHERVHPAHEPNPVMIDSQEAIVVSETSPPKRREQSLAQEVEAVQHKRPRQAQDMAGSLQPAYLKIEDGEGAGPSRNHAAAAVGADSVQEGQPLPVAQQQQQNYSAPSHLAAIQSQFGCAICQELVVHCVSTVPCGHNFCGECLAGWLVNKEDCPTCRTKSTAAPVWNAAIDSICNDVLEKQMIDDDLVERQRRKQAWEQNKQQLEAALKAPWEPRGSGRGRVLAGGRAAQLEASRGGGASVELAAVLQMLAEGGPIVPPGVLLGDAFGLGAPLMHPRSGHNSARVQGMELRGRHRQQQQPQRYAAVPPPPLPPAARPPAPQPHLLQQFRVDYSAGRRAGSCNGCRQPFEPNILRISAAPPPVSRREAQNPHFTEYYHVECVPQQYWRQSLASGILNMRGVSPADQSRVRQMQRQGR